MGGAGKATPGGPGLALGSASGGEKKKKMVIKPFKVQPKLPDNFEDDTWEKLRVSRALINCLSDPI
jgi:hypothetical protein